MQSLDHVGSEDSPAPATQLEGVQTSAAEQIDSEETAERVRELIATMPEHLRMILILGYYQKLPYAEIADILDIPVGTVKSRLHSAVNQFGRLWQARQNEISSS
jgi:RNA polymerase sigma-70 factor (ECF subfamily)